MRESDTMPEEFMRKVPDQSSTLPEHFRASDQSERMMVWFDYGHLPDDLKKVSSEFRGLATMLCALVEPGPERTVALRKLLEAKDAAVRAKLKPGG